MSYNKDKQFNNGETLNAEDLNQLIEGINGSVTNISLGTDNVTLTITKNDGSSVDITLPSGGGGSGNYIDVDYESTSKNLTPEANTEYYYGTLLSFTLSFGQGNAGDMWYITFTSGETATTLTVDGTNAAFKDFIPEANSVVEICGKWNGSKWVVLFMQTAVAV